MVSKRIVVAIDRSSQTNTVFETALEQAELSGANLMIVHTIRAEPDVKSAPFLGIGTIADVDSYSTLKRAHQERTQHELDEAQKWLDSYSQKASARGIPVETSCHAGEAASWICDLAQNWKADLIVLGRRGHQGLSEMVLGSVSNHVIHHAPCSVLVVQGSTTESKHSSTARSQTAYHNS